MRLEITIGGITLANIGKDEQTGEVVVCSSDLLPCPFCGAPAGEVVNHFQPQLRADGTKREARSVQCSRIFQDCMGAGPIKDSELEARAAWNTRWKANDLAQRPERKGTP